MYWNYIWFEIQRKKESYSFIKLLNIRLKTKDLDIPNLDILRVANNKLVAWNVYAAEKECKMV